MSDTFLLNGKETPFRQGQTILDAAKDAGIEIPTLCYLKGTAPTGACRICLVEVKGARALQAACSTPVSAGMEVTTNSELVHRARKLNVELLLSSGKHNCMTCEANGNCRLQDLAYFYKITGLRFKEKAITDIPPTDDQNSFIVRDGSKCMLCGRCVQACNELLSTAPSRRVIAARTVRLSPAAICPMTLTTVNAFFADSACRPARLAR